MTDNTTQALEPLEIPEVASANTSSNKQQVFLRYFTAILIDLVVLNLFAEYWEHVAIDSFTISLLAAVLLQILLKLTLMVEHQIGLFFKGKSGAMNKFLRVFLAWLVLFGSKFVILYAINFAFGDAVYFGGPFHGVAAFIAVVVAILASEEIVVRFYRTLA
ncbi:MAG: hypothetical protein JJ934_17085 [Pseudomonadales bacterium]|nr:hypothetical protein [Pseudomonadales bacterium]MBO6658610.1 hypothetical protein [Pseudomonadales bacterium]MBO6700779.1 hypothetical protein [Pseudomonadales bacterium]MBO7004901.1 hypothetical protein [Pseudomonadales bacterium]